MYIHIFIYLHIHTHIRPHIYTYLYLLVADDCIDLRVQRELVVDWSSVDYYIDQRVRREEVVDWSIEAQRPVHDTDHCCSLYLATI